MTYELKEITVEDQQKILKDAEYDTEKHKRLSCGFKESLTNHWIVNSELNSYLLWKPSFVRRDAMDFRRYFFFKECMYEISKLTFFGTEVAIIEMPPEEMLEEFKQEVTLSFMADNPSDAFVPIFTQWQGERHSD
jgi:hypothetical protein